MDLSRRLGILERQEERKEPILNDKTVKGQVNTGLGDDENFQDCPTNVLAEPDFHVEPILNEGNNYTIILKEMNQGNVEEKPEDDQDNIQRSSRDTSGERKQDENEICTTEEFLDSDGNEEQQEECVAAETDNNNSEVMKKHSESEDKKFVTCSVCEVRLLRKS